MGFVCVRIDVSHLGTHSTTHLARPSAMESTTTTTNSLDVEHLVAQRRHLLLRLLARLLDRPAAAHCDGRTSEGADSKSNPIPKPSPTHQIPRLAARASACAACSALAKAMGSAVVPRSSTRARPRLVSSSPKGTRSPEPPSTEMCPSATPFLSMSWRETCFSVGFGWVGVLGGWVRFVGMCGCGGSMLGVDRHIHTQPHAPRPSAGGGAGA